FTPLLSLSSFLSLDPSTSEIYTLSLHDALPILLHERKIRRTQISPQSVRNRVFLFLINQPVFVERLRRVVRAGWFGRDKKTRLRDRKSTRLNSSHLGISYAVFCLKKKKKNTKKR